MSLRSCCLQLYGSRGPSTHHIWTRDDVWLTHLTAGTDCSCMADTCKERKSDKDDEELHSMGSNVDGTEIEWIARWSTPDDELQLLCASCMGHIPYARSARVVVNEIR